MRNNMRIITEYNEKTEKSAAYAERMEKDQQQQKNETRSKIKKRTTKAHVVERQNLWK